MRTLETEIRLLDVALCAIGPIRTALDGINSRCLERPKLLDSLRDVYDLYASQLPKCGQPLTQPLLTDGIPVLVFTAAIDQEWIPYPLFRPQKGAARDFLDGWRRPFRYRVKKKGLTERFGHYRTPNGFGAWFKGHLESRVAFWRANPSGQGMVTRESEPAGKGGPSGPTNAVTCAQAPIATNMRNPDLIKRDAVIRQNSALPAKELCGRFDLHCVPLVEGWADEFGVSCWVKAYAEESLRSRIDALISKTRRLK
jgi:hypothetical protein